MGVDKLPDGRPAQRYGRSAGRRRPSFLAPLALVVVLLAGTAVAVVAYRNLGTPPIDGERLEFAVVADDALSMRFRVTRDEPDRPAVCIVRARSLDGDETGRREVYVPPGPPATVLSTVVSTSRPPVSGDVYGCTYSVPQYLVTPTATTP